MISGLFIAMPAAAAIFGYGLLTELTAGFAPAEPPRGMVRRGRCAMAAGLTLAVLAVAL